ncbi:MAG: peptide deformylase [Dehalococcoidia bacterium]
MAILPIVTLDSPNANVLRRSSNRVRDVREPSVQRLIDDMFETMRDAPGVGLAAPQVGVPLRLIVIEKVDEAFPELALANPEIVKKSGSRVISEGCLSIPGYQGELTRSEVVVAKGIGRDGREVRIKAPRGSLLAQALEHEIGHVNGHLYVDNLDDPKSLYRIRSRRTETETEKEGDAAS